MKKSVKIAERAEEPQEVEPEEDLDEQIRMENLKKLSMGKGRGGKSTKSPNMKSPKTGKSEEALNGKGPWWEEHKVTQHEIPQNWKRQEVYNMGPSSLWWKGQQGGSEDARQDGGKARGP